MAHEDYQEMLAAQALSALDADEARELHIHLEKCADCRAQLSQFEDTAAALAFAAIDERPLVPPAALRTKILDTARNDGIATTGTSSRNAQVSSTNVVPIEQGARRRWPVIQNLSAVAASLILVVLGASLFVLWRQNREAQRGLTRLSDQLLEARQQLARQREAIEIISAPGARVMELSGTSAMPGAHAMLAYDKNGRAVLMAKGLPPPPKGKAYQLWFIAGGRPMPGKVFMTDSSGGGMVSDQVPVEALTAAVFAVTLEEEQGVKEPAGAMFLKSGA